MGSAIAKSTAGTAGYGGHLVGFKPMKMLKKSQYGGYGGFFSISYRDLFSSEPPEPALQGSLNKKSHKKFYPAVPAVKRKNKETEDVSYGDSIAVARRNLPYFSLQKWQVVSEPSLFRKTRGSRPVNTGGNAMGLEIEERG